jgi:hypothetical protein
MQVGLPEHFSAGGGGGKLHRTLAAPHAQLCHTVMLHVLCLTACRWGYQNISVLEEVVANYTAMDLPLEVVWSDIEYMSTRFWTMEFDECELLNRICARTCVLVIRVLPSADKLQATAWSLTSVKC